MTPGAVLRNAPAFFLCKGGHDGDQQLTLGVQRPDVLLLKVNLHTFFLKLSDGGKAVHGITGKSADALGHDEVNLAVQGILNHPLEALAVLHIGARYAFVRIYGNELPIVPPLDIIGVVIHLGGVAG